MNVICKLSGHDYFIIKKYSPTTRKVGCRRCPKTWGMNDRVKAFIEWDSDLANLHEDAEEVIVNKNGEVIPKHKKNIRLQPHTWTHALNVR